VLHHLHRSRAIEYPIFELEDQKCIQVVTEDGKVLEREEVGGDVVGIEEEARGDHEEDIEEGWGEG